MQVIGLEAGRTNHIHSASKIGPETVLHGIHDDGCNIERVYRPGVRRDGEMARRESFSRRKPLPISLVISKL